jgi:GTP-binding protein
MANPFASARFALSAHNLRQLPPDQGREVAFAGRSNAGKSSALNTLCHQTGLARTSKTPGRTQMLVYFDVAPGKHLVDLPGYGYAKVPEDLRAHWQAFINDYFRTRQALAGLVVVMDARHPLREYDRDMLAFATGRSLPAHCLLTKADKLGRGEQAKTLQAVRKDLAASYGDTVGVQLFSSTGGQGVDEARRVVAGWLASAPVVAAP